MRTGRVIYVLSSIERTRAGASRCQPSRGRVSSCGKRLSLEIKDDNDPDETRIRDETSARNARGSSLMIALRREELRCFGHACRDHEPR